jgi:hypothetical protein
MSETDRGLGEVQRHVRGDPIQKLGLFGGFGAPAGVAAQHREDEPRRQVLGLELAEEVPALPDAYGLEHGVPELRGMRRDEPGRYPDPGRLIKAGLHEILEAGNVHPAGTNYEAALPSGVMEDVEVDVRGYGVGRNLQGVKLAWLYKAEIPRTEHVPAPFDAHDHLSLLGVHDEVIQKTPPGRVPRGPYGEAGVTHVRNYSPLHRGVSLLLLLPQPSR